MGRLNEMQRQDRIVERCHAWWNMCIDNDLDGVLMYKPELSALLQYFKELNDKYLALDPVRWIQMTVILKDLEISLENLEEGDEELFVEFEKGAECLEDLWKYLEMGMI